MSKQYCNAVMRKVNKDFSNPTGSLTFEITNQLREDRKDTNNNRKKILNDFYNKVIEIFYIMAVYKKHFEEKRIDLNDFESKCNEKIIKLETIIKYFKEDAYDSKKEYLAFRRYIIKITPCFQWINCNVTLRLPLSHHQSGLERPYRQLKKVKI